MSREMLLAVLEMPMDQWDDSLLDKMQRHSRYVEAAKLLYKYQMRNRMCKTILEELKHKLATEPRESIAYSIDTVIKKLEEDDE
jgi:hypothetical protein